MSNYLGGARRRRAYPLAYPQSSSGGFAPSSGPSTSGANYPDPLVIWRGNATLDSVSGTKPLTSSIAARYDVLDGAKGIGITDANATVTYTRSDADLQLVGDMAFMTLWRPQNFGGYRIIAECSGNLSSEAQGRPWGFYCNNTGTELLYSHSYGAVPSFESIICSIKFNQAVFLYEHVVGFIRDTIAKTISFIWGGKIIDTQSYTNNPTGGGSSVFGLLSRLAATDAGRATAANTIVWNQTISAEQVQYAAYDIYEMYS